MDLFKRPPQPSDQPFTTLNQAYAHFLDTHFNVPGNVPPIVRMAFMKGAHYMKELAQSTKEMSGPDRITFISRLYTECKQEMEQIHAVLSQPAPQPQAAPGMDLGGVAPGPKPDAVITQPPVESPTGDPATAPAPMMWTVTMVQEFEAAAQGARQAQAPTFPFKGKTFRTADAPAIINHLRQVFAGDQPQPPQPRPQ